MGAYVPSRGDLVTIDFDPQAGHEQKGLRPALVVSHAEFSRGTNMCIACPITRNLRSHPFHVPVPAGMPVTGVVMVEQVRSVDLRARGMRLIGKAPDELLDRALAILDACIY